MFRNAGSLDVSPTSRGQFTFCVAAVSIFVICNVNTQRMLRVACNVSCQVSCQALDGGVEEEGGGRERQKVFFFYVVRIMPWPMQRRNSREMQKGEKENL